MSGYVLAIDEGLAAALRDEEATAAHAFAAIDRTEHILDRINYHGIAGLLHDKPTAMAGWPGAVTARVRDAAMAQAMWELRHRQLLNELLRALAEAKVVAILLKGTALAYDLYSAPAARARGDSDLLVAPGDLAAARLILARLGYERSGETAESDDFSLQEVWTRICDHAMDHHIDLHWQLLNSPALEPVLPFAECAGDLIAVVKLGPDAVAMDRVRTLLHTCIHRTLNFTSPYFVDGRTYYGGDRLIWLHDIHLLGGSLSPAEWQFFCHLADEKGVAAACLDGLLAARRFLATEIPASVRDTLGASAVTAGPSSYLGARQFGRAWQDLRAIPGLRRKLDYFRSRTLPSPSFIRDKYPRQTGLPLPLLYLRRMVDLVRARPTQGPEQ